MTDPLLKRFTEEVMPEQNINVGIGLDIAWRTGR